MKCFADFLDTEQLDEIAIKSSTARMFALGLIRRVISRKKAVQSTDDTNAKLNALADLTADAAYLSALSVAIDQNDPTIMRKLKIK
jgi:hypothetical protein